MKILVNFEDSYGITDIACNEFFGSPLDANISEWLCDDVIIRRRLASGVFMPITLPADVDTVIFVYDMDRLKASAKEKILDANTLEEKIAILNGRYEGLNLKFVPVAFCAETISLHLMADYCHDYSKIFSSVNTAHLHTKILCDKLSAIHSDTRDQNFWRSHGKDKHTLMIKKTRNFICDFDSVKKVALELKNRGISKENETLFNWLCSGDIHNTDILLTGADAVELQRNYNKDYSNSISDCGGHTVDVAVGNSVVSYRLDEAYKT